MKNLTDAVPPASRSASSRFRNRLAAVVMASSSAILAAACASESENTSTKKTSLTLMAYDSFVLPPNIFDPFTAETGITVDIALGGDAGELIAKAALTSGNPEGDVLWGVDNTLLSRALDADIFDPYTSTAAPVADQFLKAAAAVVTPVDFGHVCINYDIADLAKRGLDPPLSFEDLIDPAYEGLLVVQNPAFSSPGLAFLLATVARYGENWTEYWQDLVENDVLVVDGWSDAYYSSFTKYGGDRPLVVSYSTSPPAEVLFADPPLPSGSLAPTGVVIDTCFEQVEFAGVLRGSNNVEAARRLIDFLVSRTFQEALPENLFVYPVNTTADLPASFIAYAPKIVSPSRFTADEIAASRQEWIDIWTALVFSS